MSNADLKILKKGTCSNLSGKSKLTYEWRLLKLLGMPEFSDGLASLSSGNTQ